MVNTNFPQFVLMFVIIMANNSLFGQETKEAVILYNTQPVKAEITNDGNITRIIREEPDFLKGFTLKVQDYSEYINEKNKPAVTVASSQPYTIKSSIFKLIKFEPNYATLSDEALDELETVVLHLRENVSEKVLLMTLSKMENSLITKNRLNSLRSYFKIRGIDQERVVFESLLGDVDVDEIKIHYLK